MYLHICPECQQDNHAACWKLRPAPPGVCGGSKCTCRCDGVKSSRPTQSELRALYTPPPEGWPEPLIGDLNYAALTPAPPYPVTCDFCGAKTDSDHAVPEESDMWACDACWERFEKEDSNEPLHEGAD